jgi:hypothetical protein
MLSTIELLFTVMDFYTGGFNPRRSAYLFDLDHFPCVFGPLNVVIRGLAL